MTTRRRLQANRRNALASTGPKSVAGKARAAMNARRHGLAIPARLDSALDKDVESLARAIAGEGADSSRMALAREIAEAQIDVVRVRAVRRRTIECELTSTTSEGLTRAIAKQAEGLVRLDRYERRALSRRKFAMRAFDASHEI